MGKDDQVARDAPASDVEGALVAKLCAASALTMTVGVFAVGFVYPYPPYDILRRTLSEPNDLGALVMLVTFLVFFIANVLLVRLVRGFFRLAKW